VLGLARIAEAGLFAAAAITAAIAFLGVITFDMSMLFGLLLTPIAVMLSAAVLAFVLLRHKEKAALSTTLIAAAIVLVLSLMLQQYTPKVLIFIALCWVGTLVVASVLLNTVSLRLAVLSVVPVVVLIGLITNVFKAELVHFWQVLMSESLSAVPAAELENLGEKNLHLIRDVMPAMLAESESVISWALFIITCAVFIARYWQAQLFNAGGFQKEFHSLRLGREAVIGFVVAFGLAQVFSGPFFGLITSALMFVFFIQGLSVLHCLTKQRGLSKSWLTGMYAILWLPPTVFVLSVLGIADNLFRIREI